MKQLGCSLLCLILLLGVGWAGDPMRTPIRTFLPDHITAVGPAAQYYAEAIGYRLVIAPPAPANSSDIAKQPIHPLVRTNIVLPTEEAILALVDPSCKLIIDHAHKLFSFEPGRTP